MKARLIVSLLSLLYVQLASARQTDFLPQGFCPEIVDHAYYSLCYLADHRQSSWVKYKLTRAMVNGRQKRTNDYRMDPVVEDPVYKSDYRGSGYDRGHLLPAGSMKLNHQSMSETFYMSNMSPQTPKFNRQIWARIEERMRDLVRQYGEAHVVTAGILHAGLRTIKTGISVPDQYFKVAYFPQAGLMKAFLIDNRSYDKNYHYSDFLVTVDEVEALTGYDFFSELPDPEETRLESTLAP